MEIYTSLFVDATSNIEVQAFTEDLHRVHGFRQRFYQGQADVGALALPGEFGFGALRFWDRGSECNGIHATEPLPHPNCIIACIDVNRFEITSPGGLAGNVTPETIIDRQYNRNPILAVVQAIEGAE